MYSILISGKGPLIVEPTGPLPFQGGGSGIRFYKNPTTYQRPSTPLKRRSKERAPPFFRQFCGAHSGVHPMSTGHYLDLGEGPPGWGADEVRLCFSFLPRGCGSCCQNVLPFTFVGNHVGVWQQEICIGERGMSVGSRKGFFLFCMWNPQKSPSLLFPPRGVPLEEVFLIDWGVQCLLCGFPLTLSQTKGRRCFAHKVLNWKRVQRSWFACHFHPKSGLQSHRTRSLFQKTILNREMIDCTAPHSPT